MYVKAEDAQGYLLVAGNAAAKADGFMHDDTDICEALFAIGNDMPAPEWLTVTVMSVTRRSMVPGDCVVIHDDPTDKAPGWERTYMAMNVGWHCILDTEALAERF